MNQAIREAIARTRFYESFDIDHDWGGDTCGSLADHFNDLAYELCQKEGIDVSEAFHMIDREIDEISNNCGANPDVDEIKLYRKACRQIANGC